MNKGACSMIGTQTPMASIKGVSYTQKHTNCVQFHFKNLDNDVLLLDKLPYSIRILLESAIRNCDGFQIKLTDVEKILDWEKSQNDAVEIPFRPARVILQDFT